MERRQWMRGALSMAIAIPANTLYSFTPGPQGLTFINFRPGVPGDIHFKDGRTMDETGYWRQQLPAPQPITLAGSDALGPKA